MDVNDVRVFLDPDEPDYAAAALMLGPEALEPLAELAGYDDALLASKAVYLAGLIGGEDSASILNDAAVNPDPVVRIAAAASVGNLEDDIAVPVSEVLMTDADVGVRKVTVQSAAESGSSNLRAQVRSAVEADVEESVRSLAPDLDD